MSALTKPNVAMVEIGVPSRTALSTLNPYATTAYLAEVGREGMFTWKYGDYSRPVLFDSQQGVYVAPASDTTGASGCWVRADADDGYQASWFGYVADWDGDDNTATDNAAALQCAINVAGIEFGTGYDTGGGGGGNVHVPRGTGMINSPITVQDGVQVYGMGVYSTVLKMYGGFPASSHFVRLGTEGKLTSVCDSQSRASAGDLIINGDLASGGVARLLQKRGITIYAAADNSAVTFTVYGKNQLGASVSYSTVGPVSDTITVPGTFIEVTRVATSAATNGPVAVGFPTLASFGSRLEAMQLYSEVMNATSGKAMVYSNNAQHTSGVKYLKIFGGNRHCTRFETGTGGASCFMYEDIETFNHGNASYVASNNAQAYFDYSGLLTNVRNLVQGGPGVGGGAAAKGVEIAGGHFKLETYHIEGVATGIYIRIPTINEGAVMLCDINGSPSVGMLVDIDSGTDDGTVVVSMAFSNGSPVTVNDQPGGASITGNVIPWTTY